MIRRVAKPKNKEAAAAETLGITHIDGWSPTSALKQACRRFTASSVRVAGEILLDERNSATTRLKAAEWLMDRGWGKPSQSVEMSISEQPTDALKEQARMLALRIAEAGIDGTSDAGRDSAVHGDNGRAN
jgi:hypothetical protein